MQRDEFDAASDRLAAEGAPLKADRGQAWLDFAGWRVNYDTVLLALCSITMAPPAVWSSDRAPAFRTPASESLYALNRPQGSELRTVAILDIAVYRLFTRRSSATRPLK